MTTTQQLATSMTATVRTYAGLFFVALATLMLEILLTRIFSVTMQYHFAFAAVSLAMFGMTLGALIVYLRPRVVSRGAPLPAVGDPRAAVRRDPGRELPHAGEHPVPRFILRWSRSTRIVFTYVVVAVPFVFSGIAVTLALTQVSQHSVGRLYAADLAGAALGCILIIYTTRGHRRTDGGDLSSGRWRALGAFLFALDTGSPAGCRSLSGASTLLLAAGGRQATRPLVWREFPGTAAALCQGRVRGPAAVRALELVFAGAGDRQPRGARAAVCLGPERDLPGRRSGFSSCSMDIDVTAGTVLTHYTGRARRSTSICRCDVTNIGYYIRPTGDVLVVGDRRRPRHPLGAALRRPSR